MEKKKIVLKLVLLFIIFLWLFFVGQIGGVSAIKGDINIIDEGQFGAWVNHMLHGKVIYKEFFSPYGPMQVYPLYVLVKLFGPSFFVVRLYTAVIGVFLGICVALYALKTLKVNKLISFIAILFFLLYPGIQIRSWVAVLCFILVARYYDKKSKIIAFLTGVLISYSMLQSIEVGTFIFVILTGFIASRLFLKKSREVTYKYLAYLISGIISTIATFSIFAMHEGWLIAYIKSNYEFLPSVSGINLPNGQGLPNPLPGITFNISMLGVIKFLFSKNMLFYWNAVILLIFQTTLFIRLVLKKITREDGIVFLVICYSFLTYFSIIGRSGHHFLYAPFVVLLAGYFLTLLFTSIKKNATRATLILSITFFALFIGYIIRYLAIYRYTPFFNTAIHFNSKVHRVSPLAVSEGQAKDIIALQRFINKNTKKTDTIFFVNNIPGWYFLLDRENATRFDYSLLAISKKQRLQLVDELKFNKPVYIFEDIKAWSVDDVSDKLRNPEVFVYLKEKYFPFLKIRHFIIYKAKK